MNTTLALNDLFLDELADVYGAKHQIVEAMPKLAHSATCRHLQAAILAHLEISIGQFAKLEDVFESFGESAKEETCEATRGLLEESDEIAEKFKNSPAINGALICIAQKVEHYEIATYGCLYEWAGLLHNPKAASILKIILNEEKAANRTLSGLARVHGTQKA